jgi:hypothetical protein
MQRMTSVLIEVVIVLGNALQGGAAVYVMPTNA